MTFRVNANMEAKLAEYRARKIKEQRKKETFPQRFLAIFSRRTSSGNQTARKTTHPTHNNKAKNPAIFLDMTEMKPPQQTSLNLQNLHKNTAGFCRDWKMLLWVLLWMIFIELQFGAVFFAVSALVFVYLNTRTGQRGNKASLSAYSVFNPNCERLQGTITAEQFEAELLYRKPLAQS